MAKVDVELAASIKQAKLKPMFFAFVANGPKGKLLLAKTKVPAREEEEAKSELGGGKTIRGRCKGEDGTLVFEIAKDPAGNLADQLKKTITRDTGMILTVNVRKAGDLEEEKGEAEGEASPEETADTNAGPFKAQLQRCEQLLEALTLAAPDQAKPLQAMLNLARKRDQEKNYKQGLPVLKELETRLQAAKKVEPTPPKQEASPFEDMYQGLLETIPGDLQRLRAVNAAAADQIQKVVDAAKGLAQKGDFKKAFTFLDQATKSLAKAQGVPVGQKPSRSPPKARWPQPSCDSELQQVRLQAAKGVDELESALRGTGDPRALQVADIVKRLAAGFPTELEGILERLDAAVKASDSGSVKALRTEVQRTAKSWMGFLQTNADYIRGCETNPWKIPVRIAEPIKKSLAVILRNNS